MPFALRRRALLALAAAAPFPAWAAFPERPLRLVVPFPAGGAADLMARGLAQHLGEQLGQQVIIDNRGGAGGTVAAEIVARAPADGYTLLFGTMGTQAINPALYAKLRYDPLKDFAPVALTHITPRVLVVGASVKADSVAQLVALARSRPGQLTYGSAGNGSSSHLSGALFESLAGVDMVHVPYKGSAPLLTDLLAGRVDATCGRWRSPRARAWRPCRRCRRWPSRGWPATRCPTGSACWRRRARRRKSSPACMRRWAVRWPTPA
jgi:tripartite-type tricarboxylate transporter receptor subunit TctC